MSFEGDLTTLLRTVAPRSFSDFAPLGTAKPYVTFQKVGGQAWNYLEGVFVGSRHARVQVNTWAESRPAAAALSRAIEVALVQSGMRAYVESPAIDVVSDDLTPVLFGARQDFSFKY